MPTLTYSNKRMERGVAAFVYPIWKRYVCKNFSLIAE